jgi:hypothetical protein
VRNQKAEDERAVVMEQWARVTKEPLYQFLKFDPIGRTIMSLFADGQISLGKAAQAITEQFCLHIEPELPEWTGSHGVELPELAAPVEAAVAVLEKRMAAARSEERERIIPAAEPPLTFDQAPNPLCGMCFGTGSWVEGEACACTKPPAPLI